MPDEYVTGADLRDSGAASPEDGMAVLVFFEGPPTADERRTALDTAREAMVASFADRGIPTPPGGWRLATLHPDEPWREWISPHLIPRAEAELAEAGPGAVVRVYYAYRAGQ